MTDHEKQALKQAEAIVTEAIESKNDVVEFYIDGLTMLPESLRRLKALRHLTIGSTSLETLPNWIPQFEELKVLQFMSHGIRYLPEWFIEMKGLESLNFTHPEQVTNLQIVGKNYLNFIGFFFKMDRSLLCRVLYRNLRT